jgi:hypothetical protein
MRTGNLTVDGKWLELPKMTTTERDEILSPRAGLEIYNTTTTQVETFSGSGWLASSGGGGETGALTVTFDGGGSPLTATPSSNVTLPYSLKFDEWRMFIGNGETGSISLSVKSGNYENYPPSTNMPSGETGPFISNGWKNTENTSTWSGTTGSFGDIVRFGINSVDGSVTNASVSMVFHKL